MADVVWRLTRVLAYSTALTALLAGSALYYFQRSLIYPASMMRSRLDVPTPDSLDLDDCDWRQETLHSGLDRVEIRAFVLLHKKDTGDREKQARRPTVLLLHANAGNMGHRLPLASVFHLRMGANVVLLSYRGYGHSKGSPSEQGIEQDADAAMAFIKTHPVLGDRSAFDGQPKIILYGQSLGGAVATYVARKYTDDVRAVVLENTFTSLPELVPVVMPYLAPFVPFLLRETWPTHKRLSTLAPSLPVLFLSGTSDELIPPAHMRALHAAKRGRRDWRSYPYGTHNDTCAQKGYWQDIADWLRDVLSAKYTPPDVHVDDDAPLEKLEGDAADVLLSKGSVGPREVARVELRHRKQ